MYSRADCSPKVQTTQETKPVPQGTLKSGEINMSEPVVTVAADAAAVVASGAISTEVPAQNQVDKVATAVNPDAPATQDDKFAAKFAALSRKQKQVEQRERLMEQREKDWNTKFSEQETSYKSKYIDPDALTQNPLKILQDRGLSPEKLAELILNDGKKTPQHLMDEYEKKMQAKFDELNGKLTAKDEAEKNAKIQEATDQFKSKINSFANENAEYELIRANEATDLVYDTIEEYYNQTLAQATEAGEQDAKGIILNTKEACDLVEKYLEDEAKKIFSKAPSKLSKFAPGTTATAAPAANPQGQSSPTLSNAMSTSSQAVDHSKLSDQDSKKEAAKLIKWLE